MALLLRANSQLLRLAEHYSDETISSVAATVVPALPWPPITTANTRLPHDLGSGSPIAGGSGNRAIFKQPDRNDVALATHPPL